MMYGNGARMDRKMPGFFSAEAGERGIIIANAENAREIGG